MNIHVGPAVLAVDGYFLQTTNNLLHDKAELLHSRLRFPVGKNRVWVRFLMRLRLLANIRTYYAGDHKLGPHLTQCGRAEAYTSVLSDILSSGIFTGTEKNYI